MATATITNGQLSRMRECQERMNKRFLMSTHSSLIRPAKGKQSGGKKAHCSNFELLY
jgi:hypothetical protein